MWASHQSFFGSAYVSRKSVPEHIFLKIGPAPLLTIIAIQLSQQLNYTSTFSLQLNSPNTVTFQVEELVTKHSETKGLAVIKVLATIGAY